MLIFSTTQKAQWAYTDVNFHLQKSLEIFDKNSADKIWSKIDKDIKVSPLIPIRVKTQDYLVTLGKALEHTIWQ